MTLAALLLFIPVYALAAFSPGPAVAAMVARTLARGTRGAAAFILGLIAGDLTWLVAASSGLGLIAQAYAPLFRFIQYAGAAYLLFMAVMMWRAEPAPPETQGEVKHGSGLSAFLAAYVLTLGNPKTMVFFLSIMPLVLDPDQLTPLAVAELALVCAVVLATVFAGYVLLAARARRLFTSRKALRRINRGTAAVMAGTAALVATR